MSDQEAGTYRAAMFVGVGKPLELQTHPLPNPGPGEVLVRVTYCTVCGSDLHTYLGHRSGPTPSILGHEVVGIVERVGGEQPLLDLERTAIEVGQRVTWSIAASCGQCARCQAELPQKCERLFKYGHEALTEAGPDGGLAEYCLLRAGSAIIALPDNVPDAVLCPANCATATVMAAVSAAGELAGQRVLILGAGMLGLTAAAVADDRGAASITVVDPLESREDLARRFGATRFLTKLEDEDDLHDVVFELSGHIEAVKASIRHAAIGGNVVLVGTVSPTPDIEVNPEQLVRRCLSIHGVHNYHPRDLAAAVEFLVRRHHDLPFATLVERHFTLEDANQAIKFAAEYRPIRIAIGPPDASV